jgi:hypothetical protein
MLCFAATKPRSGVVTWCVPEEPARAASGTNSLLDTAGLHNTHLFLLKQAPSCPRVLSEDLGDQRRNTNPAGVEPYRGCGGKWKPPSWAIGAVLTSVSPS